MGNESGNLTALLDLVRDVEADVALLALVNTGDRTAELAVFISLLSVALIGVLLGLMRSAWGRFNTAFRGLPAGPNTRRWARTTILWAIVPVVFLTVFYLGVLTWTRAVGNLEVYLKFMFMAGGSLLIVFAGFSQLLGWWRKRSRPACVRFSRRDVLRHRLAYLYLAACVVLVVSLASTLLGFLLTIDVALGLSFFAPSADSLGEDSLLVARSVLYSGASLFVLGVIVFGMAYAVEGWRNLEDMA